jgi:membrane protease subunit (stomatin/prohibitin family)
MGMGMNAAGGVMGGTQQPQGQQTYQQVPPQQPSPQQAAPAEQPPAQGAGGDDLVAKLTQLKTLADQGIISQEEFEAAKAKALGL